MKKGLSRSENPAAQQIWIMLRTDSPPLHLRNPKRKPIISSGLGFLGRYCSESRSDDYQHTINSSRGKIDGNTTKTRVRGARGAESLIHTNAITFRWVYGAVEPTEPEDDTILEKERY